MGNHSQLGPIDPQLVSGAWQAPARAILRQFEQAKEECRDPALLGAWIPILQQYGPALIQQCEAAETLAKRLVQEWLEQYMFLQYSDRAERAERTADYFADYETHQSHSLGIDREQAREHGVIVDNLESNQDLQDAVLSVHHATMHTFQGPAVKIVENHLGRAFVKVAQQMIVQMPMTAPGLIGPQLPGGALPGLPGNPMPPSSDS
jgi:hypothetical protein